MNYLKSLVLALMIVFIMPFTVEAELHSDTVIGNGEEYVDIQRSITRGGVILPIFYTSKRDLYGYPVNVVCTLREVHFKDVIDLYKDLYNFKDITVYDDLRVIIYETYFPYDIKQAYREVKDADHHEYCEVSFVTNDERMGRTYVVEIPDEVSPAGNPLYWFTKFDRMLTKFPSPFTPKSAP